MDNIRVIDVVGKFNGATREGFEPWIDKLYFALRLMSKETEESKVKLQCANLIPLFLEGPAYATWKQLDTDSKNDFDKIKKKLQEVFGKSKLQAWKELKEMKFLPQDSIDVMADTITTLLRVVLSDDRPPPEEMVSLFLIDALPPRIMKEVKLLHGTSLKLTSVLQTAKTLLVNEDSYTHDGIVAAGAYTVKDNLPIQAMQEALT